MSKRIFKKLICLVIGITLILLAFTSCQSEIKDEKVSIVCVDFYEYDWVRNIIGENPAGFELILLNDTGTDMHSFQPTVKDMATLYRADLLIFTDGISEFWIDEAVGSYENINSLSLMEVFMHSELKDGYELDEHDHDEHEEEGDGDDHDHDHDEGSIEDEHGSHHHEADEHLHLSLKLASFFISSISEKIAEMDEINCEYYLDNALNYKAKLFELESKYEEVLEGGGFALIADRFPFTYLFQDYNIEHEEAFTGCSTDVDCKFETVVRLAKIIKQKSLDYIVIIEGSKTDLAESIINASGMSPEILMLNSMQSISKKDLNEGVTYLSIMEENLEVFKKLCHK